MPFHDPPRLPQGFRCAATRCGIKSDGRDLALFASDVPAAAAAVFTRNHVVGAPVAVGRGLIRGGRLQAVVINSGVANVGTGEEGIVRARRMGAAAAAALGVPCEFVLMSSTGVIGIPLPIEKIEAALPELVAALQDDPVDGARGIMTTDTHPKAVSRSVGDATVTVVAKGSGMIEPNMATMLAFAFTDAALEAPALDRVLREVVDETFNMLSIDTDTSTSDTCVLMANGRAGAVPEPAFRSELLEAFTRMTEILARDGEGATKLLRVTVTGADGERDARRVAKSLVNSPLIKTMVLGADPNVGRILMAVGKCFACRIEPARIRASVCGLPVIEAGCRRAFDEAEARRRLGGDPVNIDVDLGVGTARTRAWGCDLSHGYVDENAAYYSS